MYHVTAYDLAVHSPLTYDELHAAHHSGALPELLRGLTPLERVGAAAVVAERMGKPLSEVQRRFAAAIDAATPKAGYWESPEQYRMGVYRAHLAAVGTMEDTGNA